MSSPDVRWFIGRDGSKLAYREIGEGHPIVLLHGFGATGLQWLNHGPARAIAKHGFRVILPDLRGHGESAQSISLNPYTPDILGDDGLALIEHLKLKTYDLGGYSLGGRIVVRMLVRGAQPSHAIVAGQGLEQVVDAVRSGINYHVISSLANGERFAPGSAEDKIAYWFTQLGNDPQALLQVLDSLIVTPKTALRQIEVNTLVMVGDQDLDHASANALAVALPNARFVKVPGDHWTALGAQELADEIIAFLH